MNRLNPERYWEKRLKDRWGLDGVGYIGLGHYYNYWLYRVRRKAFLRHVKRLALEWSKLDVLDIGSGTGYYVKLWKSLGVRSVTATDITTIAVEKLRKEFPESECYQLDIGGILPGHFQDRYYDIISAFDVLFHIVDDNCYQRSFENIFQMLRPQGIFVFSENFVHGETIRARHQVNRSLNEIEAILKTTGFKVKARVPIFAIMNYPVDSKGTFPKIVWEKTMLPVKKFEILGFALGGLLYPLELILASCLKESPSTELMICER
jgi:SAM-dependent methyltransferase